MMSRLRTNRLLAAAGLGFMAAGCSSAPEGADYHWAPDVGIQTFLVTEQLKYQRKSAVQKAVISHHGHGFDLRRKLMGRVEHGGQRYDQIASHRGSDKMPPRSTYYRVDPSGIYFRQSLDGDAAEQVELPLPVKAGRQWRTLVDSVAANLRIERIAPCRVNGEDRPQCVYVTGHAIDEPEVAISLQYAPKIGMTYKEFKGPEGLLTFTRIAAAGW